MEIYFIRHAQSENNILWDQTGSGNGRLEDPDITEIGKQQIHHLSNFLITKKEIDIYGERDYHNKRGYSFTHLYCSPFLRAAKTGYAVASRLGMPLKVMVDLHEGGGVWLESDQGDFEGLSGKPRTFFEKQFPGLILTEEITENGWWNKPFEQPGERTERAERVWKNLLETHHDEDVIALFSHANFFNHFLASITQRAKANGIWFNLNNTGITRFDVHKSENQVDIVYVNKVDFLPTNLIT